MFRKIPWLLSALVLAWLVLLLFVPQTHQEKVFFGAMSGKYAIDFFNAQAVTAMECPYSETVVSDYVGEVGRHDQCYPALTYVLLSALPDSYRGLIVFDSIGVAVFIVGVMLLFRRYGVPPVLPLLTLLVSWRMLRSLELGNTIIYALGAVFVFLAWYDSGSRIRRIVAAVALAFAVALKISPVLLGLAYLLPDGKRRVDWYGPFLSGAAAVVLLLVPFAFFGGVDGFRAWMENAAVNSSEYAWRNGFGWYGFVASLFDVFGYDHRIIHLPLRILSSAFAVTLIARAFLTNGDRFARLGLLAFGMLFLPPTMMSYTLLYVVPLLIVGVWRYTGRTATSFGICWVACCAPLQIPLLLGSLNCCLMTAATLDVCFVLWKLAGQEERSSASGNVV